MYIEKIHYCLKADLRDGASEQITLVGVPAEDESISDCIERIRAIAQESKLPNKWQVVEEIRRGKETLEKLNQIYTERQKQWEELAHFLRTQGINPDIPSAPLALVKVAQLVQGEIVNGDEF